MTLHTLYDAARQCHKLREFQAHNFNGDFGFLELSMCQYIGTYRVGSVLEEITKAVGLVVSESFNESGSRGAN